MVRLLLGIPLSVAIFPTFACDFADLGVAWSRFRVFLVVSVRSLNPSIEQIICSLFNLWDSKTVDTRTNHTTSHHRYEDWPHHATSLTVERTSTCCLMGDFWGCFLYPRRGAGETRTAGSVQLKGNNLLFVIHNRNSAETESRRKAVRHDGCARRRHDVSSVDLFFDFRRFCPFWGRYRYVPEFCRLA